MPNINYDAIMVGGGLMGCATAYYLKKYDPNFSVAIIEMDPSYEKSSTVLSDGNIRVQFNIKENIQISIYGLQVMENFAEDMEVNGVKPDLAFHQQGNLFLQDEDSREEALEGMALQHSLGGKVEWLDLPQVKQRYPICEPQGIVGGVYGYQDGTMDPWALLTAYKNKALELGSDYIQAEVGSILKDGQKVTGVKLTNGEVLNTPFILNSAGAWGTRIAQTVGVELPMEPVKRQVFVIETNARSENKLPGLFFPSGLYIFHETGGLFMVGKSFPDDMVGIDFTSNISLFNERIWSELVEHIPSFDRLKVVRSWAGLYAVNTFDGNAILGEWPELEGFLLANGFSGHGFQQCFAVGRYIAEIILGRQHELDLSIFSPQRILDNKPVFESKRKLI
jgi:FAD-dependent oxidoreductase domain-containing protein 1